jgi:hypothetical protein
MDGAPNHCTGDLVIPDNVRLEFLPPYSPELNPQENLWEEIREKIFKNYALKSMDKVYDKLQEAALYLERNPKIVQSITAFPILQSHSDTEMVSDTGHSLWLRGVARVVAVVRAKPRDSGRVLRRCLSADMQIVSASHPFAMR